MPVDGIHTSRTCDAETQLDFDEIFRNQEIDSFTERAATIAESARRHRKLTCVEICAGAGGQAIGLDMAGFKHLALVEYESDYCAVLRINRPDWNVLCGDVRKFDGRGFRNVDLLAGGVPCPPFSVASKQLGADDDRDLFPEAIRLVSEMRPKAVMLENVRGFLDSKFDDYRENILDNLSSLGYHVSVKLLNASDFGVPQLRPRVVIIGIRNDIPGTFSFPEPLKEKAPTVGQALYALMSANGWEGVEDWAKRADKIAPTIVGGSKKHGGPDLGPVRARRAWAELGVDGLGVAGEAPNKDFKGSPRLTKEMLACIQGFPDGWNFGTRKTLACRMIGNAFPPPVAKAVGLQIRKVLENEKI
ncbi:MAG: DNA cytosine methyltransferase [Kiritimatiellae bacterium]|nr:DNA cytosine methyltransferase [Kiritimatiellia bacterium]